jgi:hypothetical protein
VLKTKAQTNDMPASFSHVKRAEIEAEKNQHKEGEEREEVLHVSPGRSKQNGTLLNIVTLQTSTSAEYSEAASGSELHENARFIDENASVRRLVRPILPEGKLLRVDPAGNAREGGSSPY